MKYCKNCKQNVQPIKKFSWGLFILFLGVFYLLYYILMKKKSCPICHSRNFEHKHGNEKLIEEKVEACDVAPKLDSWTEKMKASNERMKQERKDKKETI